MQRLLFTTVLFFSFYSRADLASEVGISISTEKINSFLSEVSGTFLVEDQEIELGAGGVFDQIQSSRVSLDLDSEINFELSGGDRALAQIKFNELTLYLQDFHFEQITIIRRSGIVARVRTIIDCPNLPISLRNWEGEMSTTISYNGSVLELSKENGSFELEGSDVRLDFSGCRAPRGIEPMFKKEILNWLRSSNGRDLLFEQAISYGQDFVNESWEKIKEKDMSFVFLGKTIEVNLETVDFSKDHIEARGYVNVKTDNKDFELKLEEKSFAEVKTEAALIFPKGFFEIFLPEVMKEAELSFELRRAEIPGVDFLFKSRFLQFFVWSDLLNFRTNSDFKVGVSIKDAEVSLLNKRETGFSYDLSGNHSVGMSFLNSRGDEFPYMNFRGKINSRVDLNLTSEGFSLKINKPGLSAKAYWHPLMKTWRRSRRKGGPWMSLILPRVEKAFNGTDFSYSWDEVGLGGFINDINIDHSGEGTIVNIGIKEDFELLNKKSSL